MSLAFETVSMQTKRKHTRPCVTTIDEAKSKPRKVVAARTVNDTLYLPNLFAATTVNDTPSLFLNINNRRTGHRHQMMKMNETLLALLIYKVNFLTYILNPINSKHSYIIHIAVHILLPTLYRKSTSLKVVQVLPSLSQSYDRGLQSVLKCSRTSLLKNPNIVLIRSPGIINSSQPSPSSLVRDLREAQHHQLTN